MIVITLGSLTLTSCRGLRTFIAAENDHWIRNRGETISYRFMLDALGAMAEDGTVDIVARRSGRFRHPMRVAAYSGLRALELRSDRAAAFGTTVVRLMEPEPRWGSSG